VNWHRGIVRGFAWLALLVIAGLLVPGQPTIPVQGATPTDWNPKSFWFEPWGKSGVHKGIDIFAKHGQPVVSATPGIVIYQGELGIGGNVVAVLGPKWRIHYYAHLAEPANARWLVTTGEHIGAVGTSGNAAGKAPHLHYAVLSVIPLPWRFSTATQGWKQMFFLDPGGVLGHGS
jgi:murein DD-endopeptidase MepM/ murein hydrolase activator NlpD